MAESEIKITYETLFELLRREKSREELQKLDDGFCQQLSAYLKEKRQPVLETDPDAMFKSRVLLENLQRIVTELYQRREKKIVDMALIKSRAKHSSLSLHTLLTHEKTLFEELLRILDTHRQSFAQYSITHQSTSNVQESSTSPNIVSETSSLTSHPSQTDVVVTSHDSKTIVFLEPVPQFVGEEFEPYGPFNAGDTANLPLKIAQLLIEKECAQALYVGNSPSFLRKESATDQQNI